MTKTELRLELIKIVHSHGRVASATLQMVYEYEKAFAGMLDEDQPAEGAPATKKTTKAA